MDNTCCTPRRMALAVLWIVSTVWIVSIVAPAASQTATNDGDFQMMETSQMMSLACPTPYHPVCVVQSLEMSLSTGQPVLRTGAGLQPRSDAMVSVELGVPEALVRAFLREERTTGNPIALHVPEALPMILATEDWE